MDHKVNDAILDANERLRGENKRLLEDLTHSKKTLKMYIDASDAWRKTAAACDGEDVYGAIFVAAQSPDATPQSLRQAYLSITSAGVIKRLEKLENAEKQRLI